MAGLQKRAVCWVPSGDEAGPAPGFEHLLLQCRSADSVVLGVDEDRGPFRLAYALQWTDAWHLLSADLTLTTAKTTRTLALTTDGQGRWRDGAGGPRAELDGCLDIDIWPTPFTNTFPIRRQPLGLGERREFQMAWVFGPTLQVEVQRQAYTRLQDRLYLFESLGGDGFRAELAVDAEGLVLDYPGLFRRVAWPRGAVPGATTDMPE